MATMLTKHFSREELACPCCGVAAVTGALLLAIEQLRDACSRKLGKDTPLSINSGYRCAKQNAKEGGAQSSEHLKGNAVDISCPKGMTLETFYITAQGIPAFAKGGIGVYPAGRGQNTDFIHVDVRGTKARWARIDGNYVNVDAAFAKGK